MRDKTTALYALIVLCFFVVLIYEIYIGNKIDHKKTKPEQRKRNLWPSRKKKKNNEV